MGGAQKCSFAAVPGRDKDTSAQVCYVIVHVHTHGRSPAARAGIKCDIFTRWNTHSS